MRVRTVVREDAFELYGFLTAGGGGDVPLLTSVSHVGPRLAMTVLSGLEVEELVVALGRGEVARLTKIHGVGKKTAERLVLELKDKVKVLRGPHLPRARGPAPRAEGRRADLVSALANLGYRPAQAESRGGRGPGEAGRGRARGAPPRGARQPAHGVLAGGTLSVRPRPMSRVPPEVATNDEERLEASLRPRTFDEYVGQSAVVEKLKVYVQRGQGAAATRSTTASSPGRRAWARRRWPTSSPRSWAWACTSPPAPRSSGRATWPACSPTSSRATSSSSTRSTGSTPAIEEYLYPAMEDFRLDITIDTGPGRPRDEDRPAALHARSAPPPARACSPRRCATASRSRSGSSTTSPSTWS